VSDQSVFPPTGSSGSVASIINECCSHIAQTYTAGVTGTLAGVSLDIYYLPSNFPIVVEIRSVSGGKPTGSVLGSAMPAATSSPTVCPSGSLPGNYCLPFSQMIMFPGIIPQIAGTQYAIVVYFLGAPQGTTGGWAGELAPLYAGGRTWISFDHGVTWNADSGLPAYSNHFKTFVNTGSGSVVQWNGNNRSTTFVSSTQLQATILSSDITSAGTAQVTVFNPGPGGGLSNALLFVITSVNPIPVLSGLSPGNGTAGGAAFTLTVTGSNFTSGSVVQWNGNNRSTTFVSSTQLQATILSSDITSAGTAQVTVFNPGPGGGLSNSLIFIVKGVITDNQSRNHIFAQFADGKFSDGAFYRSTFLVSSDNTTSINCTATLVGLTVPGFGNGSTYTFTVVRGGWSIITTPGTQSLRSGYATLDCNAPVAAQVLFSSFSPAGILLSEATIFSSPIATIAQLLADQRNGAQLGVAIANTRSASTEFIVMAIDQNDREIGRTTVQLPGQSHLARFLNELITVPSGFTGQVLISTTPSTVGNIYAIGLRFTGPVFTTIPVTLRTFR
jgi:hypothetical protein